MSGGRDERDGRDGRSFQVGRPSGSEPDLTPPSQAVGPRPRQPRWMTFFTVLMFLLGARLFLGSLDDLYRLATGKPEVLNLDGNRDPQQAALLRAQTVFDNEIGRARPGVMTVHAVGRLVLGLVYLLAVAAVVSKDARGRWVCLLAGWLGLATSVGNAAFLLLWVGKLLPWLHPRLAEAFAQDAIRFGRPAPSAELVAEQARLFLIDGPVALCGMGTILSLVVVAYFAGGRMRWFYQQLGRAHG
jgi:hypothetical protein